MEKHTKNKTLKKIGKKLHKPKSKNKKTTQTKDKTKKQYRFIQYLKNWKTLRHNNDIYSFFKKFQ